MIEQSRAIKAVEFLVDMAAEYGSARADAARAENMLRVTKLFVMKSSGENAISAQERDAYASAEYRKAVDEVFEATRDMEVLKARIEAAKAVIEVWRSLNAGQRSAERGYGAAR